MSKKKSISILTVSAAFPTIGENLVPEPPEMIVRQSGFRQTGNTALHQKKFKHRRRTIRQP